MRDLLTRILILTLLVPAAALADPEDLNFAKASEKNRILVTRSVWTFGALQKGFTLYIPLIQQTIGTRASYDSVEFAERLAAWKKSGGCSSRNGLLNTATFLCLKEYWQARRKTSLEPDVLVVIDRKYRYDPRREDSLSQMTLQAYQAYQRLMAAAIQDGIDDRQLLIVASNRSPKREAGIRKSVSHDKVGYTVAGNKSVHRTGRALDLHVDGVPMWSDDSNRQIQIRSRGYQWMLRNAGRFGFVNYFFEPWHWEYVGN
jgi:D-alanyl-D-alanine carboxypeptidase